MRYKAYISVVGTEEVVRALQGRSVVRDAQVRQYPRVSAETSPTGKASPWGWATPRADIPEGDPDKGLRELLLTHKKLAAAIGQVRKADTHVSVVLIAQREDGEDPRGLSISRETMQHIVDLGAYFEIDVVSVMDK